MTVKNSDVRLEVQFLNQKHNISLKTHFSINNITPGGEVARVQTFTPELRYTFTGNFDVTCVDKYPMLVPNRSQSILGGQEVTILVCDIVYILDN